MFEAIIFSATVGSLWVMCVIGMITTLFND